MFLILIYLATACMPYRMMTLVAAVGRADEIIEHWQRILVDRELNDRNLAEDYPTSLTRRLLIQRADLDSCVVTGGGSWKTLLVRAHTRSSPPYARWLC